MKVVKIKMLKNFFVDGVSVLYEGRTYFAIDGGDYWVVQRYSDSGFFRVVPKRPTPPTPIPIVYAEVVPTHTKASGCCPDCGCDYKHNCDCICCSL